MSASDYEVTSQKVNSHNTDLTARLGRKTSGDLDKDDFLKILITQLANQDPLEPMKDKEFIAQMAQFSSLEQMKNMAGNFEKLSEDFTVMASIIDSAGAPNLLGKEVTVLSGDSEVTGVVEEIAGKYNPQVKIDGQYYSYAEVFKIRN
ncbi:MAG: flagellar hook assembly protein FlgD [Spirochaetales bacterium]|nr:flagellar hook assembly protein FlgD [Spirochaetales bacterium]